MLAGLWKVRLPVLCRPFCACTFWVAIANGRPHCMNLKDILSAFINHRREVVTRRTIYLLRKARERAHILEGLVWSPHGSTNKKNEKHKYYLAYESPRYLIEKPFLAF